MTIDQLLADVTPLLPVREADIYIVGTYNDDQQTYLEQYLAHAGKHFPAMLAALRRAANVLGKANGNLIAEGLLPYDEAEHHIKQALAAAEVCE